MGYVFDFNDAKAYEYWLKRPSNRRTAILEHQLLIDILKPLPGKTVLDIGCGTGASLTPLIDAGLLATGLDPSPYMLDIATKNFGNQVDLHRGFAEDLPFEDNSFNYACLNTTLEFVENPQQAVQEACRVARDKIYLGVLNRYAIKGVLRRISGIFNRSIFNHARFFSVWELKQMVRSVMGDVPITWRTVCHLPRISAVAALKIEQFSLIQRCPFGMFAGMVVILVPRLITKPLTIPYRTEQTTSELTS